MDWFVDATDVEAVSQLRREISVYLARHAEPTSDLHAAKLAVGELLSNVARHAPGPAWVSITWSSDVPTLVVEDLGPGFELEGPLTVLPDDPLAEGGRGLYLTARVAAELRAERRGAGGSRVTVELPMRARSHRPSTSTGTPPDPADA